MSWKTAEKWILSLWFQSCGNCVLRLMKKLLDRGHALYLDNFYTSVSLAEALLNRKTLICGTLRKNKKHLPKKSCFYQTKKRTAHCQTKKGVLL